MNDPAQRPPELGLVARLARRTGARVALALLALLVSSAVYAPFLANDEPYYLRAVDRGAFESALTSLAPLVQEWRGEHRGEFIGSAAIEAVQLRFDTLARYLDAASEPAQRVRRARDAFERGVAYPSGPAPDEALAAACSLARELAPDAGGALRAATSFPLPASLGAFEWFAAFAWTTALVLTWRRAAARQFVRGGVAALALTALACVAFAPPRVLSSASLKAGLASGAVLAQRALFAPLPFGFAETNMAEALRPPTWSADAELDAEGRYVRGPRAPRPDPASGFVPSSTPVAVLPHEPALNSPWRHVLGTDSLGRDVLARILWGGRVSLTVGFASIAIVLALGLLVGGLSGYFRGRLDALLTGVTGVLQSFPAFFLILVAIALLPNRGVHPQVATIAVIGCVGWTGVARLVRAECLRIVELDYVRAARALGYSHARILLRHVLPNALAPVIVAAAFGVASAILTESAASFLGFGVQPPTPSWGAVMRESRAVEHWWILVFPGLALLATVLACTGLGDALRDALDPQEER